MVEKVNRYRDKPILVRVTSDEKRQIINNMHTAGMRTLTNYARMMALNGRVINIDFTTLKESLSETG